MREYNTAVPASYIFLERDGKYLFIRRCNTGYEDGKYHPPAGHVEPDELPAAAAIREAKEEIGVDILLEDLEFVHVLYRMSQERTVYRVDFIFKATKWTGDVENREPNKCDELVWASLDELPEETVPLIRQVVERIQKGIPYSEIS